MSPSLLIFTRLPKRYRLLGTLEAVEEGNGLSLFCLAPGGGCMFPFSWAKPCEALQHVGTGCGLLEPLLGPLLEHSWSITGTTGGRCWSHRWSRWSLLHKSSVHVCLVDGGVTAQTFGIHQ